MVTCKVRLRYCRNRCIAAFAFRIDQRHFGRGRSGVYTQKSDADMIFQWRSPDLRFCADGIEKPSALLSLEQRSKVTSGGKCLIVFRVHLTE